MTQSNRDTRLTESVEDYLEAILVLSQQLPQVRSVDVASYLGFSKPSVSHAIRLLSQEGLIEIGPSKHLSLSESGKAAAEETYRRHVFFCRMLEQIGVPKDIAEEDACRIEHVISNETFQAIQSFYKEQEISGQKAADSKPAEAEEESGK